MSLRAKFCVSRDREGGWVVALIHNSSDASANYLTSQHPRCANSMAVSGFGFGSQESPRLTLRSLGESTGSHNMHVLVCTSVYTLGSM